jgi:hypothetical protein
VHHRSFFPSSKLKSSISVDETLPRVGPSASGLSFKPLAGLRPFSPACDCPAMLVLDCELTTVLASVRGLRGGELVVDPGIDAELWGDDSISLRSFSNSFSNLHTTLRLVVAIP